MSTALRRLAPYAVAVLVGSSWLVIGAAPTAGADSRPCLPSGGCASLRYTGDRIGTRGGQVTLRWRVNVTGTDVAAAALSAYTPAGLTPSLGSVTLNGVPAPAGSVAPFGADLTVDLTSLLPLPAAPGSITVAYTATVSATARAELVVSAYLSYSDAGGVNRRSPFPASATLQVAFPDLAVSTTGTHTYIPRGLESSVFFGITNSGQVEPPLVSLQIITPIGFTLASTPLHATECHSIGVRRTWCTLAYQAPFLTGSLGIRANRDTRAGSSGDLILIGEPLGTPPDRHQADNTHRMTLHVRGIADLSERWTVPGGGTIPVGQPVTVTVGIHNNGPDPATNLTGRLRLSEHPGAKQPGFRVVPSSAASESSLWLHIPTIAPHATYLVSLRITGLAVGAHGTVGIGFSYPSFPASGPEPIVSYDPTAAELPTTAELTVVAASPQQRSGEALPATGSAGTVPAAVLGLIFLVTGPLMLLAARRPRRPAR